MGRLRWSDFREEEGTLYQRVECPNILCDGCVFQEDEDGMCVFRDMAQEDRRCTDEGDTHFHWKRLRLKS